MPNIPGLNTWMLPSVLGPFHVYNDLERLYIDVLKRRHKIISAGWEGEEFVIRTSYDIRIIYSPPEKCQTETQVNTYRLKPQ